MNASSNAIKRQRNSKKAFLWLLLLSSISFKTQAQQTIVQYLSGTDKDHTVPWEFMCTKGRNSGRWTTIPVPSCWEMQGFGNYTYFKDNNDPEQGLYKHKFKLLPSHKNKKIIIVFEASMTDTEVKVNGKPAGATHQGGFYEFKYDITDLVQFDAENLLEVTVSRHSANESVNRAERKADFWLFGGIFRPVYLDILPATHIERVAINAKANGGFDVTVFANQTTNQQTIEAQVFELNGKAVDKSFSLKANDSSVLTHQFANIKTWDPERPNLYHVVLSIKENGKTIHTIKQRFGFRTTELRPHDGFYVNDVKVIFKGVNRHSEWPETGRTLSRAIHLMDIAAIKDMNMNAVRMSHYPPDKEFLDLCDSLGLFVLDELTGWQAAYDTVVGRKLVKELVVRDVNHPSIVIWDNGNEGGWNKALDNDYKLYDPQDRLVIHPWEKINGTNTKHYPDFKLLTQLLKEKEVFFPTEFMHGLFDGGHGAGLDDFWNEMMKSPICAGGFLWALHDEGIVRADKNNSIDVAGNQAPDGIVGPHREREGSYYTIKEIWCPVQIAAKTLPDNFDGKLAIENHYLYTNLDQCKFEWKLVNFANPTDNTILPKLVQKGLAPTLFVAPNNKGVLRLPLSSANKKADALYLTAFGPKGDTLYTWGWALGTPSSMVKKALPVAALSTITTKENEQTLTVTCDGIAYDFDKKTGYLAKVFNGKKDISFGNGPALASGPQVLESFKYAAQGNGYMVMPSYKGDSLKVKWVFAPGRLPKLEYSYTTSDTADFMGITFNYPEEKINGMKWLGNGPYRVWKNRLKGQPLGVWQKNYNNAITGENWGYPEFKGWHSGLYWVKLQGMEGDFTVYANEQNTYLQMMKPQRPKAAPNNYTDPPFPQGNIGFMHGIAAIGTKFNSATVLGPQSQKNVRQGNLPLNGALYFDFIPKMK